MIVLPEKNEGSLRLLFWNVKKLGERAPEDEAKRLKLLSEVVQASKADIVMLAEVMNETIKDPLLNSLRNYGHEFIIRTSKRNFCVLFENAVCGKEEVEGRRFGPEGWDDSLFPVVHMGPLTILAVHAKSGTKQADYDIRHETLGHVKQFYHEMREQERSLIIMGDMNTMGHQANGGLTGAEEIVEVENALVGMQHLNANVPFSWLGVDEDAVYPPAWLDHIFVSTRLEPSVYNIGNYKAFMGGWPLLSNEADQEMWVRQLSDHAFEFMDIDQRLAGLG